MIPSGLWNRGSRMPAAVPALSARLVRGYRPLGSRTQAGIPSVGSKATRDSMPSRSPGCGRPVGHVASQSLRYPAPRSLDDLRLGYTASPTLGTRSFHASARRDALPLIPASIAVLKSTSILAIITTLSRILISFFPVGILAAARHTRLRRWIDAQDPPDATPDAEEFFKMWCEGEKYSRITAAQAAEILDRPTLPDGGLLLSDGRITYPIPMPDRSWGRKREEDQSASRRLQTIQRTRFILPPLPPASVSYFEEFTPEEQLQVTNLRRYYVSLAMFKNHMQKGRAIMFLMFILPFILISGVYISALERVPLTGRWRIILLTPEEEDKISNSLSGGNWYKSVINLLTTADKPAPPVVPLDDWRWDWVRGVLRNLEGAVIEEARRLAEGSPDSLVDPSSASSPLDSDSVSSARPRPPATGYPLRPRPRVSSRLHSALPGGDPHSGAEHLELGPPYSLMLMEKTEKNAFSYGFGGKGAGGIVVYTGLLDEILSKNVAVVPAPLPPSRSRGFFGGLLSSTLPRAIRPTPTPGQTLQLASVLAHEMGHLLLSHHLETLSQQQVLWPSVLNLSLDLVRAFIWPVTFFLGPTVNDALANVGRTSAEEMADRYGEIGFQWQHEYEADFAAIRLLASAGYDPRLALRHFRTSIADLHEIPALDKAKEEGLTWSLFKLWSERTHPSPEMRYTRVSEDLEKWEWPDGETLKPDS